jgi:enoyl-CoA hydratase/carnithine racemase
MHSEYQHWLLSQETHVGTLTLNRPQDQNSLTSETLYELRDIIAHLRTTKEVWVVILQGQGKHFCTGIDTGIIEHMLGQPEGANREHVLSLQRCLDEFEALEKPTIAKLHGFCVGGGLLLALCCDFRVASQRAIFGMPEIRLGLGAIMGMQRLTRVAGVAAAKEIIMLGKRFNASVAQSYGLLHQVVPPDELDGTVGALADRFRELPPRTVGVVKRIINSSHHLSLRESQDLEIDAQAELMDSPDLREAIESFLEKRPPRFTGE